MVDPVPDSKPAPTLGDYLAVLKMYVDSANGEKQAIWTRHATMLVGNSLIIAGVRADGSNLAAGTTIFLNGLGLVLCIVWALMNWNGWGWFHKALADGSKVPVDPLLNPFADFNTPYRRRSDSIFVCAMSVVFIFALIYVVGLWPAIKALVALACG